MLEKKSEVPRVSTFDPKEFGRKLRAAREELGLTQQELSVRSVSIGELEGTTRISTPYISALERFERTTRPSDPYLEALARGLRHKDSWTVREWAGIERDPDWAKTPRTIRNDKALTKVDQDLLVRVYYRLVGQS